MPLFVSLSLLVALLCLLFVGGRAAALYRAPFKKVWLEIDGETLDISDTVASLIYSREVEKENEVTFQVEQKYIQRLTDTEVREGLTLKFQYGFKGGVKSKVHRARIVEISYRYTRKISMTVKARDLGTVMKKTASNKIWSGVTTSDICRQIANRYGLTFQGDETTKVWDNYPQSQKDDYAFLQEIVTMEQAGNYEVFVSDGVLFLERRGLDKASALSFEYLDGDGPVISFDYRIQEKMKATAASGSSIFSIFDEDEKDAQNEESNAENEEDGIGLGQFKYIFSADGEVKDEPDPNTPEEGTFDNIVDTGERVVSALGDPEEAKARANNVKKGFTLKVQTATLKVQGEPGLDINSIVTVRGVLKQHEGNYLVKGIRDEVNTSGFLSTLKLEKNASRRANKGSANAETDPTKVNDTPGEDTAGDGLETKKDIFIFDADGNLKSAPTKEYKAPNT